MNEQEIYNFPQGIPGFEEYHRFKLMREENSPLAQLLSLENGGVGFILMPPDIFFPEYCLEIPEEGKNVLGLNQAQAEVPVEVWVILTNSSDVTQITVNLCAPILLNPQKKLGMQMILNDDKYATRQKLSLKPASEEGAEK